MVEKEREGAKEREGGKEGERGRGWAGKERESEGWKERVCV